ncbi:MAG: endolytic transglycosylase MltG [Defluviitaleaceae bacterium]|nr:endolytic transglycosylase MltG [Defluviitaleaceae bacterium]
MKLDRVINVGLYFLGMAFNLAIIAVVGFAVWHFTLQGIEWGEDLAYAMTYEGPHEVVEFVLEVDTSAAEVARMLEEQGIINSSLLFQAELFLFGRPDYYSAGTYTLNRNMTNTDVHLTLRGRPDDFAPEQVIRIPEGWTIRDMAMYFEYREFFPAEEFIRVAQYGHFSFAFLRDIPEDRPNRLEGYLFPDTYRIPINPSPYDIISRMLRAFDTVVDESIHYRAEYLGMTLDEVIIMASIIERETRLAHERPMVSQVIHSRLNSPQWPSRLLQMCSTVAYVLDIPRARLLLVDLQIDSPYNTYIHPGLPIGPIANPGEAAIRAALYPSDTNYLFFVLMDEATGAHYFTRTYAEHSAADARFRNQ